MDGLLETFNQALAAGPLLAYPAIFMAGVIASFSPCTYPVLPLTVGYIGGAAKGNRRRAFLLSLALVGGMAAVYGIAGIVVSILGMQLGSLWGNGWAVFAIAWFFILMALFLMDVLVFPVPRFLQNLYGKGGKREGLPGALMTGAVSGLVVGPCTGPFLLVVLAFISVSLKQAEGFGYALEVLSGGAKLVVFGLGQGALILLAGTFAGLLTHLPKAGQWMVTIKKGFALLILLGASLLLVHVGQGTDFPSLMGTPTAAGTEAASGPKPGDEFLK